MVNPSQNGNHNKNVFSAPTIGKSVAVTARRQYRPDPYKRVILVVQAQGKPWPWLSDGTGVAPLKRLPPTGMLK